MNRLLILLKGNLKKFTLNEYVVLMFVASCFISVFLEAALMLLLPLYMILSKQFKLCAPRSISEFCLVLFSILALVSTVLFSKNGIVSDFVIKKEYLIFLGIGIVILAFDILFFTKIMTKKAFFAGIKLSLILSITSFITAVIQKILKIYPDPINRPGRVSSVFMNENYYGTMIEFICLFALYMIIAEKARKSRIFYTVIFVLNVIGLWLCQTRMAFVVVALSMFVFLFVYDRKMSYGILGIIGLGILILCVYPQFLPRFDSVSSYLNFRLGIWDCAVRSFFDSPLMGRGYYSYSFIWQDYFSEMYYPALHAHNLYIELLINFGILGTLPLAVYCVKKGFSCIKNSVQSQNKLGLALTLSIICAVLVHGLADTTILWPQTGFFVVFVLASPKVYLKEECA